METVDKLKESGHSPVTCQLSLQLQRDIGASKYVDVQRVLRRAWIQRFKKQFLRFYHQTTVHVPAVPYYRN